MKPGDKVRVRGGGLDCVGRIVSGPNHDGLDFFSESWVVKMPCLAQGDPDKVEYLMDFLVSGRDIVPS